MSEKETHQKLVRAMARLVAHRKAIHEQREALQKHAAGMVDVASHRAAVAAEHLETHDNILVHRYARTHITEAARLRAVSLRAEAKRATDAD